MCFGTGSGTQTNPTVRWWYHVAPVIHVRNAQGVVTEMVMDPSLANRPLTIQQWSGLTRNDAFARMSLGEVEQMLSANRGLFPSGQNIVYTADRDAFYPANTPSAGAYDEMEKVRETLTRYSRLVAAHELAAVMRLEMRNATIDLNNVITLIHNATSDARVRLRTCFPSLLAAFRGRLAPADVTRLDTEINLP